MEPTKTSLEMSQNCSTERISELPNDVIQRILSSGTVEDAVRFCTLSGHWKSLWTSMPNLLFRRKWGRNVRDFDKRLQKVRDFASFVELYSAPKGRMSYTAIKLDDLPSLMEANVCFETTRLYTKEEEDKKMIVGIVEKLHHVKRLVIGASFFQVLSPMKLDGEFFPAFSCTSLKINLMIAKNYLHRMEVLLHSFPCVRELILNVPSGDYDNLYRKKLSLEMKNWRSKNGSLECLNQHLEKAEIIGDATWYQNLNLVKLAQFLLDNAKVLQKLTIPEQVYGMYRPLHPIEPKKLKNLLETKEKLLQYPRASPNAVVVFETGRQ